MSISFQKSVTQSFIHSDTISRNLLSVPPDFQSVWAFLVRQGFTPFDNAAQPTQGVQIEPLYLRLDETGVWETGETFTYFAQVDPLYNDMTEGANAWGGSFSHVNTTFAQYWLGPQVPPTTPPSGYSYGLHGAQTITSTGTTVTITWAPYDDGGTHYYGLTITVTLSTPYTYQQFATSCSQLLSAVELQNPAVLYPGKTKNNAARDLRLVWHSQVPRYRPKFAIPPEVGSIGVTLSRAGGYQFTDTLAGYLSAFSSTPGFGQHYPFPKRYCEATSTTQSQVWSVDLGLPLAAFGMPFAILHPSNPNFPYLYVEQTPSFNPIFGSMVGAGPLVICCVKSCINNARADLTTYGRACTYAVSTDSWTSAAAATLSNAIGIKTYTPSDSPVGCLLGQYAKFTGLSIGPAAYDTGQGTGIGGNYPVGQPLSLYALGTDKHGIAFDNPAVTWAFGYRSGNVQPGDLVASSNYAILTPSGTGQAIVTATCQFWGINFTATTGMMYFQ